MLAPWKKVGLSSANELCIGFCEKAVQIMTEASEMDAFNAADKEFRGEAIPSRKKCCRSSLSTRRLKTDMLS